MHHVILYAQKDRFAGWPANNGVWTWQGHGILVGCSLGDLEVQPGHNISGTVRSVLLRSLDDGESWALEDPAGYLNDPGPLSDLSQAADFSGDGFAMRVVGTGYHGTEEKRSGFYLSADRGTTWRGPYRFRGIVDREPFCDMEMTPRTDYVVNGAHDCTVFLSARAPETWGSDKVFCARTTDGGQSFQFVSWMVPPSDPYRAVMPSTVRCSPRKLVSAVRRRDMNAHDGWIDAYVSTDDGQSWSFASKVGDAGSWNGNPPSLARLRDGRLCCVYGNRDRRQIIARTSADEGRSWGNEQVLRADFFSLDDEPDLGYPRLVQCADGHLVAIYYWATADHPQQHIEATIWMPAAPI
jgi:hypothetical protein